MRFSAAVVSSMAAVHCADGARVRAGQVSLTEADSELESTTVEEVLSELPKGIAGVIDGLGKSSVDCSNPDTVPRAPALKPPSFQAPGTVSGFEQSTELFPSPSMTPAMPFGNSLRTSSTVVDSNSESASVNDTCPARTRAPSAQCTAAIEETTAAEKRMTLISSRSFRNGCTESRCSQ